MVEGRFGDQEKPDPVTGDKITTLARLQQGSWWLKGVLATKSCTWGGMVSGLIQQPRKV